MNTAKKLSGIAIASAAAALFLAGCSTMESAATSTEEAAGSAVSEVKEAVEADVHCMGVNACKGQTACATAENSCKGQNSCKGTGWVPMSEAECEAAGGTVSG